MHLLRPVCSLMAGSQAYGKAGVAFPLCPLCQGMLLSTACRTFLSRAAGVPALRLALRPLRVACFGATVACICVLPVPYVLQASEWQASGEAFYPVLGSLTRTPTPS